MQTFFSDDDYRAYLSLLVDFCVRCDVRVWGYCLMPNHVHLIVVPSGQDGLARALGETHRRYTRRVNFREGWRGYLWQGRFASFVMDQPHLLGAAAYIERNPVKAGLVEKAEQWPWSSAKAHVRGRPDGVAETDWLTDMTAGWVCTWRKYLRQDDVSALGETLRGHESTGRPLGEESFIRKIGVLVGRELLRQKTGPKTKKRTKTRTKKRRN
jgi:putative transposase